MDQVSALECGGVHMRVCVKMRNCMCVCVRVLSQAQSASVGGRVRVGARVGGCVCVLHIGTPVHIGRCVCVHVKII